MLELVKAGKVAPIPVEKRAERDQPLARSRARSRPGGITMSARAGGRDQAA